MVPALKELRFERREKNKLCPLKVLNVCRKVWIQPLNLATFPGERKATEPNCERLVRTGPAEKAWFSGRIFAEYKELSGEWVGVRLETKG